MIEINNLSKRYKKTLAVDSLSFTVKPGQVTGFLGPNGAGKSTTMRLMLGLDRPTAGEVLIDGKPYAAWRNPLRKVGALFEGRAAHGGRTGYHHLKWMAQSNGIALTRVGEVLRMVGLEDAAGSRTGRYSLGMAQRLGIAAALLGDPQILLLDEPVNGLDPEGIIWIRELMKSLAAQGRTVLVSSHFMAEMAMTAEHLVVIVRGRLVADTTVAQLTAGSTSLEEAFVKLTREVPDVRG